ncbi:MAG: hypothetical protein ABEL97_12755 [Salinibacter sp.]
MDRPSPLDCNLHDPHLYNTRRGRVLRCACCGRIQIEFCGLTLLVDADEFETLLGTVAGILDDIEDGAEGGWRLAAPTDAGEVSASLDADELRALYELLAGAQAMRALDDRLTAVAAGRRRERPASSWPA